MSEENILDFFGEDFSLFVEAGFIAVKQLDEIASRRLFRAAEILRPDSLAPQLGLGYIALNKLHAHEAAGIFEAIVQRDPEHQLAKALLGISFLLIQEKRQEGERLIREAKEKSDDVTVKNLVDVCLDWLSKDLKGKPLAPVGTQFEGGAARS